MSGDKLTLQKILQLGYAASERRHPVPDYVRRAVWALLACRTARLGGHIQACPDSHVERIWDHSCRHRMCPPCAWVQVQRWLGQQKARLLGCAHYHVIFTLPHELNDLWLANVEAMSQRFFGSVHDTFLERLGDGKYLGGKPGIIATLHTWSQTLLLHPHLHCLVTGGGLSEAGQWVAVRQGFLLPVRVVMAVFRGKLRAAIREGIAQGELTLPAGKSPQQWENLLNTLGRVKWHVHIRERYPHGGGVLISLARDLRGGPIASRRLVSCEGQPVVFGYEERAKGPQGQATPRTMRLPLEPCIGRWLLHVPPRHAVRVRCWGLYAHTQGDALAHCRQQLGQEPVAIPPGWDAPRKSAGGAEEQPACCPVCGSGWCARPSSPGPVSPRPTHPVGSRWHERAHGRREPEAGPGGTRVASRGATGGL